MRSSVLPVVYIFFSPFLMLTVRRCCVSAWVATSHHAPSSQARTSLPFRQAAPQLHPAFMRCRGGNSDAAAFSVQTVVTATSSSRGSAADVVATSNEDSADLVEQHTPITSYPSPESLQHLGGGFTPRQFGGLSYWDTSSLDKFRVIFVLGGPGAGMY
jgi:hypothetical protein